MLLNLELVLSLLVPAAIAIKESNHAVATSTLDNLQEAFNGESNPRHRYLAFAAQADVEGFAQVASLFALHHHLASCVMSADLRWRRGTSCAAWYAATRKRITSQSSKRFFDIAFA